MDRSDAALPFAVGRYTDALKQTVGFRANANLATMSTDFKDSIINSYNNRPINIVPTVQNLNGQKSMQFMDQE